MPFIGILTQPEEIFNFEYLQWLIFALKIETPKQLILPITPKYLALLPYWLVFSEPYY